MTNKIKRRKFKLPTAKQLQQALPVVSAGLSILSALPFNKKATRALAVAAAVTNRNGSQQDNVASKVKNELRVTLSELSSLGENPDPQRMAELTATALKLAQLMVEN